MTNFAKMNKYTRILPVILLFCSVCLIASADRGRFDVRRKITLDVNPADNIKNAVAFTLKSGTVYKGSLVMKQETIGNTIISDIVISYKKGNTIYLLPAKQRVSVPKYSPKEGSKLTIQLRK